MDRDFKYLIMRFFSSCLLFCTASFGSMAGNGSFLDTLTGCTTVPTLTGKWSRVYTHVALTLPATTGTSNTATLTIKTLPPELRPATLQEIAVTGVEDNGIIYSAGLAQIATTGIITLFFCLTHTSAPTAVFTTTGVKGWTRPLTLMYQIYP
jgi:hypothetical protein